MTDAKSTEKYSVKVRELPPSVGITCENISAVVMMNYRAEEKNGLTAYSYTAHDHTVYEAYIIEEGSAKILIGDKTVDAGKNELLIIPPLTKHQLLHTSGDFKRFCIRFKFDSERDTSPSVRGHYLKDTLAEDELRFIFEVISELRDIAHSHGSKLTVYRETALLGVVFSYILERMTRFDIKPPADSDGQIELYTKIENYLYLNYNQPITLDSLASYLSYSRTQMRRIIEECYGIPFTEKLRDIRLAEAKRHLTESEAAIEEIAARCGYETRQGFETMFLKFVGLSPNQFRKKYRS